ncbi:hypothetical protein RFI_17497, partial [Reticulomyxa filosa]
MNTEEDEKNKEKVNTGVAPVFSDKSCFNKDWILQSNKKEQINYFTCLICKQVANYPLEITCHEHKNMDELLIVGKRCLQQFLEKNNNTCPIQTHDGCQYRDIKQLLQINNLTVICPHQFQLDLETPGTGEEGTEEKTLIKPACNFKGDMKELIEHLHNSCPLKLFACWFRFFGCDHSCMKELLEEHLTLEKKYHFDLVIKHAESLQQKIQYSQEESMKLQVENQTLKLETELKVDKLNKEIHSKNDEMQQLKDDIKLQLLKKNQEQIQLQSLKIDSIKKEKQNNELTELLKEKDKQIDQLKEQSKNNDNNLFKGYHNNCNIYLIFLVVAIILPLYNAIP